MASHGFEYIADADQIERGFAARESDFLGWYTFGVGRVREAFRMFTQIDPIDELHLRACNKGTKTMTEAAFMVACLQKRRKLDGVTLPQWEGPVEGAQFVLDYTQQLLSVQPAYLRVLGSWPCKARYTGEVLKSLRIKPVGGSNDISTWSVIHFLSQENRKSGIGVRADIAAFDEPPIASILREMRKAAHANRRGIRLIGETPTIRSQWAELKADYGDTPRRSIRRIDRERAEVRWSLEDVASWILPDEEKAKLVRIYESDPLKDARIHGDYIDASGSCPFHIPTLQGMMEKCVEPEIIECSIQREADSEEGRAVVTARVPVEVFRVPKVGISYYGPIDASSGINTWRHDPGGMLLTQRGSGDLAVRFSGYIGSYGLGTLGAILGRQYNNAIIDPENNAGWIEGVLRGLSASRYGYVAREKLITTTDGQFKTRWGFNTNFESRSAMVAAIQAWLESFRAGVKYGLCPSQAMLQCLMDIILDEKGKPVAAPGFHDEDMVLWGQSLRRCVTSSGRAIPVVHRPKPTAEQELISSLQGRTTGAHPMPQSRLVSRRRRP